MGVSDHSFLASRHSLLTRPIFLALIATLANAVKPVVVDDTAYLTYSRHIAAHPLDPYGFEIYWYTRMDDAMGVLCPPVLPYWLAAGYRLFENNPFLLKLWLFPFIWLFAQSLVILLSRFARGVERTALPLLVLSPAVLPTINLMLDIPALALGLTSLVVFIRAVDRGKSWGSWWLAVAAGLIAALAMQTKYTQLLIPPLLIWYGLTHRRIGFAIMAVGITIGAFAAWEALLAASYGQSHFLVHLTAQSEDIPFSERLEEKSNLIPPLAGYLGCLAVGVGLYMGRAIGLPRWVVAAGAVFWVVGAALVTFLPHHETVLLAGKEPGSEKLTLAALVWRATGTTTLLTASCAAAMLLVRCRFWPRLRHSRDSLFLFGWVLLEIAGYFALTPFPAARRVLGIVVALGILSARVVSRVNRAKPERRPPGWVLPFGIAAGFLVAAIDTYDAWPEKSLAHRAADAIHSESPNARIWFSGHWGFQYYCEKQGMVPAIPGQSELQPGDYLVLPIVPDSKGFYRPSSVHIISAPPVEVAQLVGELVWDDWLSAQTVPNFYGGVDPIVGRDAPRLRVGIYRMRREWVVGKK